MIFLCFVLMVCYMYCILFNFSDLLLIFFSSMFNVLFSECVFSILLTDIVRTIFIPLFI